MRGRAGLDIYNLSQEKGGCVKSLKNDYAQPFYTKKGYECMKSLKKFFALALALALCFVMALPAMATEGETGGSKAFTLTMNNPTEGHTYNVYQIFTGDISGEQNNPGLTLSNVKYGANYTPGEVQVGDVVPLADLDKITDARKFALDNFKEITTGEAYRSGWNGKDPLTDLEAGYYLIVDKGSSADPEPEGDADSAIMVELVGDTAITPKTTTTTFDKSVADKGNADIGKEDTVEWKDAAGHAIGETFQFKLTAYVPVKELDKFESYHLKFHDQMSKGVTFEEIVSVMAGGKEVPVHSDSMPDGYTTDITENKDKAGLGFTVDIADILKFKGEGDSAWTTTEIGEEGSKEEVVVVEVIYNAHLNEDAKVMVGTETNTGSLEYTRGPDSTGDGETEEDKVYIFTFDIDGSKVDDTNASLAGAVFALYEGHDAKDDAKPLDFMVVEEELEDGTTLTRYILYTGKVADANPNAETVTSITTEKDGKFVFEGLKAGDYTLKEIKAPEGYNKCWDKNITITASPEVVDGNPVSKVHISYTSIETNGVDNAGMDEDKSDATDGTGITIMNKKGSMLPSTGGIGTTIFYAVGGVLVVGAGVLLIVKKRLGSKG